MEWVKKMQDPKEETYKIIAKHFNHNINFDLNNNKNIIKNMYILEESHWQYQDVLMKKENLVRVSFPDFIKIFCPQLRNEQVVFLLKEFNKHKKKVPVSGAIILNCDRTKILLVKNRKSNIWSYPKGKREQNENEIDCVVREVYEETNYNIEHVEIKNRIKVRQGTFYIIENVSEDITFVPWNTYEIDEIKWHRIENISESKNYNIYIRQSYQKLLKFLKNKN